MWQTETENKKIFFFFIQIGMFDFDLRQEIEVDQVSETIYL